MADYSTSITIHWHVDDVLTIRPDLDPDKAANVLARIKHAHDANIGINWEVLEVVAEDLFPKPEE